MRIAWPQPPLPKMVSPPTSSEVQPGVKVFERAAVPVQLAAVKASTSMGVPDVDVPEIPDVPEDVPVPEE